jgi:hypothetical protein
MQKRWHDRDVMELFSAGIVFGQNHASPKSRLWTENEWIDALEIALERTALPRGETIRTPKLWERETANTALRVR